MEILSGLSGPQSGVHCTAGGPEQQRAINIQEGDILFIEENQGTDPIVFLH